MSDKLRYVPVDSIRPNEVALRSVDRETEKFQNLVDSVRQVGILNPIVVREMKDNETGNTIFGLVDGLQRFTSAKMAGLDAIPVHVITANDAQTLEAQIIGNLQRIDTKPIEYTKQLQRLLVFYPTKTTKDIAAQLGVSDTWVCERLNLLKLTDEIQKLVDDGTIKVTNACALAKLPAEEQALFVDRAIGMSPAQFTSTASVRAKEIRDAKRAGRKDEGPKEFTPIPFLQNTLAIKEEMERNVIGPILLKDQNVKHPEEAWNLALKWVLHLDPRSIQASKEKNEARMRQLEAEKAARKEEARQKKEAEGAKVAASLV